MAIRQEIRHKGAHESKFVGVTFGVGSQRHEQHRDMCNGHMVAIGLESPYGRLLGRDRQETGENPFDTGAFFVGFLEPVAPIVNLTPDRGCKADEDVAALLLDVLWVLYRAEEIGLRHVFLPMEGARVLTVSDARFLDGHLPTVIHGKVGRTVDFPVPEVVGLLFAPRIMGNDRGGLESAKDELENVLGVIRGISRDRFDPSYEGSMRPAQKLPGGMKLMDVGRVSDFLQREFGFRITQDMIAVSPKIADLLLPGRTEVAKHSQPGIWVTSGRSGLVITAVFERGLQIVFSNRNDDRARIQGDPLSLQDILSKEFPHQATTDLLKQCIRGVMKKRTETLDRRDIPKDRKANRGSDGRIVHEFKDQVVQRRQAAKGLVNERPEQRVSGYRGTSSFGEGFFKDREPRKQPLVANPWRQLLWLKEEGL